MKKGSMFLGVLISVFVFVILWNVSSMFCKSQFKFVNMGDTIIIQKLQLSLKEDCGFVVLETSGEGKLNWVYFCQTGFGGEDHFINVEAGKKYSLFKKLLLPAVMDLSISVKGGLVYNWY